MSYLKKLNSMSFYSMQDSQKTKELIKNIISEIKYNRELRFALRDAINDYEIHPDKRWVDDRDWSHYMTHPSGY